jgi:hypothetical protein
MLAESSAGDGTRWVSGRSFGGLGARRRSCWLEDGLLLVLLGVKSPIVSMKYGFSVMSGSLAFSSGAFCVSTSVILVFSAGLVSSGFDSSSDVASRLGDARKSYAFVGQFV